MDRRRFLLTTFAGVLMPHSVASQPSKAIRIGWLAPGSTVTQAVGLEAFRQGLRQLGYVEGPNFAIESRNADGKLDRLPGLAAELVRLPVDLIVTSGPDGARAAQQASRSLPIVVAVMHEPIAYGFIASFARPGGNITGLAFQESELTTKKLEILHEALPRVSKVGVLYDPRGGGPLQLKAADQAARALGLTLQVLEVRSVADFPTVFETAKRTRLQAVLQLGSPLFGSNPVSVAEMTTKHRLPTMCEQRMLTVAGCLMSYGPHFAEMFGRAATFVDKILKGTNPAELPVEQPTRFEFVINMKTAKALGLTIPPSLLLRADQVIE
jgi:putative ABC transport system substrate-binding protein